MLSEKDFFEEQKQLIEFGMEGADMLALADIGYGKTICVWTIIQRLLDTGRIDRAVIFAPMRVARLVWPDEQKNWTHLQHITVATGAGESARKRRAVIEGPAQVITFNYETMPWFFDQFGKRTKNRRPLQGVGKKVLLALDEVDKMKSPGTARFKKMRALAPAFVARIGLTGTPTPNHLHEIWGQAYLVALENCGLGTSYEKFKKQYFYSNDFHGYTVKPHAFAESEIFAAIAPYTYRIGGSGTTTELRVHDVFVELEKPHRLAYEEMETKLIAMLDQLDDPVVAKSAAAAGQKLTQMAAGFVYYEDEKEERQTHLIATDKLRAIDGLISELQGEQIIVVYNYLESKRQLMEHFGDRAWFLGKGKVGDETVAAWNRGEGEVLCIHPASAGHGLNLHLGGCRHLAYVTLPWSGGLYEQTNGRVHRRNQKRTVFIHRVLARDTIDERIAETLELKQGGNKAILAAMKRWTDARRKVA